MSDNRYTVDAKTRGGELLDGQTRTWVDAITEAIRLKRLLRPICFQVHLYRELPNGRRFWVKGWSRPDRHSPWKPAKEEP